jgi:hypothetical protein
MILHFTNCKLCLFTKKNITFCLILTPQRLIWETDKTRYVSELDPKWSSNIPNSELHLEISRSESGKIPAYQNEPKPEKYLVWSKGPHKRKSTWFESDKIMFHLEIRFTCFYSAATAALSWAHLCHGHSSTSPSILRLQSSSPSAYWQTTSRRRGPSRRCTRALWLPWAGAMLSTNHGPYGEYGEDYWHFYCEQSDQRSFHRLPLFVLLSCQPTCHETGRADGHPASRLIVELVPPRTLTAPSSCSG